MQRDTNPNIALDEYKNFLKIFSHDFGAPIRHIEEFTNILNRLTDTNLDQDTQECLYFINNSILKLKKMQSALMNLSKIRINDNLSPLCDANTLIDNSLAALDGLIDNIKPSIEVTKLNTKIPEEFQVVFTEIIKNALIYNDNKSIEIFITAIHRNGEIIYSVKDNGIGISNDYHEKVFDIFRRLHGELEYGAGIGAGLAIAKSIVEKYHGKIWISTSPKFKTEINFGVKQ